MLMIFIFFIFIFYWYGTRNHGYWCRKNVEYEKPLPFFGNDAQSFLRRKSILQAASEIYWRHPGKRFVGVYRGNVPQLIIRDPDLIKDILVTNFKCFQTRGLHAREDVIEPLLQNLFFVDGELWRMLRQCLTPAFTTGKLKAMFPLIVEIAEKLQIRVDAAYGGEIDARDLMARYTTDFIGTCGFGVDANSLDDDNSIFKKLGVKIYKPTIWRTVTILLKCFFPNLCKSLKFLGQELEDDVTFLVKLMRNQRNNQPSTRGDFLDLMLELLLKGESCLNNINGKNSITGLKLDDQLIAAQCFIFFAAGFETSTSATTIALHQLAYNPNVQYKVQAEIDKVLDRYNGKLSYEAMKEMTYLEWSLMEALRIFPPGLIIRKCTSPYTIPNTNIRLERGIKVLIPTEAIHNDPLYFHCPEDFRPERFSPENVAARHKFVYLPFGKGPKYCIVPKDNNFLHVRPTSQDITRDIDAYGTEVHKLRVAQLAVKKTMLVVSLKDCHWNEKIWQGIKLTDMALKLRARLGMMQSLAGLAAILSRFDVRPSPNGKRHLNAHPASTIVQSIDGAVPLVFRKRVEKT